MAGFFSVGNDDSTRMANVGSSSKKEDQNKYRNIAQENTSPYSDEGFNQYIQKNVDPGGVDGSVYQNLPSYMKRNIRDNHKYDVDKGYFTPDLSSRIAGNTLIASADLNTSPMRFAGDASPTKSPSGTGFGTKTSSPGSSGRRGGSKSSSRGARGGTSSRSRGGVSRGGSRSNTGSKSSARGARGSTGSRGRGGTGTGSSRSGGTTGRSSSSASRGNTGRGRSQCDIRTKIDVSPLINSNLVKDNLAEVAYFVQEIKN